MVFSFNIVTEFKPEDKLNTLIAMEINEQILEFIDAARCFAVALILKTENSAPRKAGTKAVIDDTGRIWGTLGGGKVEAQAQRCAIEACKSGAPVVFDMDLYGASRDDETPICGGSVRILIDPAASRHKTAYAQAAEALRQRRKGLLITKVTAADKTNVEVQWISQEQLSSHLGFPNAGELLACLKKETPQLLSKASTETDVVTQTFIEPVIPRPLMLIVGGGHIGQALAAHATLVGFDIAIIEDRTEYANPALFPQGTVIHHGDIPKQISQFPVAPDTYIVIVTRGHKHDARALELCMHRNAAYVGMIGSKRKAALIRENFIETGICTEAEYDRVFTPVGLDIGAVTVPEIAVSITAEIIAVRRNSFSTTKSDRKISR